MSHSLWIRLMRIFLGVIILGVITMVVSLRISTATHVKKRVLSEDVAQANELAGFLAGYYANQGSWAGAETLLTGTQSFGGDDHENLGMGPNMMADWLGGWFRATRSTGLLTDRVVILNPAGEVVVDTSGSSLNEKHPPDHFQEAAPIMVGDEFVGAVLVGSMIEPMLNPADEDFLRSVNLSILVTAVAVSILALVLGSLFFRQITLPIRALSQAAEAIAAGQFGRRVQARTNDEIGQLAKSFNQMAESLAQAEVQRRNMVADIAHELRTPLTIVQGNLEALLDGVYELNQENIAATYRQSTLLSRLVADLRDLALAESGQLRLEWQQINLSALIVQVSDGLKAQALEKDILLQVDFPERLSNISGDEHRIKQVLFNLLSNALRHTPRGGTITTLAEIEADRVVIRVRDTGSGISPQDLPHIFERFYRADRSRTRSTGGSGLGLAISRRIVELHGGEIWAESWLGVGSTFSFSLPLEENERVKFSSDRSLATCPSCNKSTEPDWVLCAYCGNQIL